MVRSMAIIGSFQKYYDEILGLIRLFKEAGLYVLSPKESSICGRIDDFVIFESDREDFTPADIQMITLDKLINADVIYVYNPNGYIGKTTCYEIGFCFSKRKPIYFFDVPKDLPISISIEKQVIKPGEFVNLAISNRLDFLYNYNLCPEGYKAFCHLFDIDKDIKTVKPKNIVICGSMFFFDEMLQCQQELEVLGIHAIIPREENEIVRLYDEKSFMEFKRKASQTYLKKIREKNTVGVLIYNAEKNGISNYIGANTLVELAMAFTWNRKIFLFNDIYEPLKEELIAWECICLNGNLDKMKSVLIKENRVDENNNSAQISLFDFL